MAVNSPSFDNTPMLSDSNMAPVSFPLHRRLKNRHLQMIAIGGSIGTGLFVSCGTALTTGGPGSLMTSFVLVGVMIFCTMHALGELATTMPFAGAFFIHAARFIDPAWGFAIGWNYALQWLLILPLEILSGSLMLRFWTREGLDPLWTTLFLGLIIVINHFGIRGYGEAEFIFSAIKVTAIVGYIILGCIINVGGEAVGSPTGFGLWSSPGAFKNGMPGFSRTFVSAAASFGGIELVGLAAAETANPSKAIPLAVKQVFWRIALLYLTSLLVMSTLVAHDEPDLLSSNYADGLLRSPFVISIVNAGIEVLPSIMNSVILIAVLSVGNSAVYASSRTLLGLAWYGLAPTWFVQVDKKGRPWVAIGLACLVGMTAYLSSLDIAPAVFQWLFALSVLSTLLTWATICLTHIRFRQAWKAQGRSAEALVWRSPLGSVGSWVGLVLNLFVLTAQVATSIMGFSDSRGSNRAKTLALLQDLIGWPVVLGSYMAYKVWRKTRFVNIHQADIHYGVSSRTIERSMQGPVDRNGLGRIGRKIQRLFL